MKKIEAIIKPFKMDAVRDALTALGITGMTILECRGFGRQKGHKELFRGSEYVVDLLPKIKVEVVVDDDSVLDTVSAIMEASRTENIGDGKIFVSEMSESYRIRTGESGSDALQ